MTDLQAGWAVVGNDGRRLGTVQEVGQNYVLTSRGALITPLYVPASAIANVEHDMVYLNLTRNDAARMGWEQPPREPDAPDDSADGDLHRHV